MMSDLDNARAKYSYDPESGVLLSKRLARAVSKNGMVNGKQQRPYQIAFLLMEGYVPETIDHRDGDRTNNKWSNLRAATRLEQSANTSKAGIRQWPSGKWYYQLSVVGKRFYQGGFASKEEARQAFDQECIALQGDFCTQLSRSNKKEDE